MINFIEMAILGILFGSLAVAGVYGGSKLGVTLKDLSFQFSWVMADFRRCRWCYEICRIRYPDEGYDVRRNVGIPVRRFRYG